MNCTTTSFPRIVSMYEINFNPSHRLRLAGTDSSLQLINICCWVLLRTSNLSFRLSVILF
ncbi:hypothetical protein Mapa_015381 [Marchantia paleacea]|nr:hypothetical protein Mapa_015381 [Marchantia paleacea]